MSILNKLYNPISRTVFLEYGIRDSYNALAVGCGGGEFACWLATQLQPCGHVLAIDKDEKQLKMAMKLAKSMGIHNIKFCRMSLEELPNLREKFDFVYARWVLMYLSNKTLGVNYLYEALKPSGVLICEDIDSVYNCVFSYPNSDILFRWINYWEANFDFLGLKLNSFGDIYDGFLSLSLKQITTRVNQPILSTDEEKSVFRLGIDATKQSILSNGIANIDDYGKFLEEVIYFERQSSLIWYFRNTIIAGKKPGL